MLFTWFWFSLLNELDIFSCICHFQLEWINHIWLVKGFNWSFYFRYLVLWIEFYLQFATFRYIVDWLQAQKNLNCMNAYFVFNLLYINCFVTKLAVIQLIWSIYLPFQCISNLFSLYATVRLLEWYFRIAIHQHEIALHTQLMKCHFFIQSFICNTLYIGRFRIFLHCGV